MITTPDSDVSTTVYTPNESQNGVTCNYIRIVLDLKKKKWKIK